MTTSPTTKRARKSARAARPSRHRRQRSLDGAVPDLIRVPRQRPARRRRQVPDPVRAPVPRAGTRSRPRNELSRGCAARPSGARRSTRATLRGAPGPLLRQVRRVRHRSGARVPDRRADPRSRYRRSRTRQLRDPRLQPDGRDLSLPYRDRWCARRRARLPIRSRPSTRWSHARARHEGAGHRGTDRGGTIEADAEWQPDPAQASWYIDALASTVPTTTTRVAEVRRPRHPVTSHSGSMGWPDRSLSSNFVGNHLGHFAQSHHISPAACSSAASPSASPRSTSGSSKAASAGRATSTVTCSVTGRSATGRSWTST